MNKKSITLPLSDFLDILLTHRESCTPDSLIITLVQALDKEEFYTHIQYPDKENNLHLPMLWRIKAWKSDVQYRELQKVAMQKRVAKHELRKQLQDEIATGFMTLLMCDEATANDKARVVVETHNIKLAKLVGVDLTELEEKKD